jgi:hypothetical protein
VNDGVHYDAMEIAIETDPTGWTYVDVPPPDEFTLWGEDCVVPMGPIPIHVRGGMVTLNVAFYEVLSPYLLRLWLEP